MNESITMSEILAAIDEKVATDEDFRVSLITDPRGTLSVEYDIEIPDDYDLAEHELTDSAGHVIVPMMTDELSDADLKEITGGRFIAMLLSKLLSYQKSAAPAA